MEFACRNPEGISSWVMSSLPVRVAVVGGGVSGCTLSREIAERFATRGVPVAIDIFERGRLLGGRCSARQTRHLPPSVIFHHGVAAFGCERDGIAEQFLARAKVVDQDGTTGMLRDTRKSWKVKKVNGRGEVSFDDRHVNIESRSSRDMKAQGLTRRDTSEVVIYSPHCSWDTIWRHVASHPFIRVHCNSQVASVDFDPATKKWTLRISTLPSTSSSSSCSTSPSDTSLTFDELVCTSYSLGHREAYQSIISADDRSQGSLPPLMRLGKSLTASDGHSSSQTASHPTTDNEREEVEDLLKVTSAVEREMRLSLLLALRLNDKELRHEWTEKLCWDLLVIDRDELVSSANTNSIPTDGQGCLGQYFEKVARGPPAGGEDDIIALTFHCCPGVAERLSIPPVGCIPNDLRAEAENVLRREALRLLSIPGVLGKIVKTMDNQEDASPNGTSVEYVALHRWGSCFQTLPNPPSDSAGRYQTLQLIVAGDFLCRSSSVQSAITSALKAADEIDHAWNRGLHNGAIPKI